VIIQLFNLLDTNDTVFALVVGGCGLLVIGVCYLLDKLSEKEGLKND
jgi:hypothetical protein